MATFKNYTKYGGKKIMDKYVYIDGIAYDPESPILKHKDQNGEIWCKAKEYYGYWQNKEHKNEK